MSLTDPDFVDLVRAMRKAQTDYFKSRKQSGDSTALLVESRRLEQLVDNRLRELANSTIETTPNLFG